MPDSNIKIYKVGKLEIKIDRSLCISCATCVAVAPNTFELDEDLISVVKEKAEEDTQAIVEAAQTCSGVAITVIDTATGKTLWPK